MHSRAQKRKAICGLGEESPGFVKTGLVFNIGLAVLGVKFGRFQSTIICDANFMLRVGYAGKTIFPCTASIDHSALSRSVSFFFPRSIGSSSFHKRGITWEPWKQSYWPTWFLVPALVADVLRCFPWDSFLRYTLIASCKVILVGCSIYWGVRIRTLRHLSANTAWKNRLIQNGRDNSFAFSVSFE